MKSIKVRPADEKDLRSLVILAEEFMPGEADNGKRINVLKQALRNSNYELLVAELEGEVVGFIDQWVIHDFTHGAKLSYIHILYVSSEHRRKGVASKLLQEAMKMQETREFQRSTSQLDSTTSQLSTCTESTV